MSFPVANSTTSFWRGETHPLDDHRTTEKLPSEVDVVIIGAGYAGASIAHHLLEQGRGASKPLSIAILEAREACSGATGRNGGHLKPDPYHRAAEALKIYGREAAEEVAAFEARQIGEIKKLVEKENVDCDFVMTRAADVCLFEQAHSELKDGFDRLNAADVSTIQNVFYSDGKTAEGVSGVKGAKACFTYPTAHMWPYKLVLHLLSQAVSKGVNLQTHTPVQNVVRSVGSGSPRAWTVDTPRGSVQASKVIHASNAYTSALLPEYKQAIVPVRGICCHIVPTKKPAPLLSNSYMMRIAPDEFDYLIPRTDGSIVVGGGRRDYYRHLNEWYDVVDDSKLIEPAKKYFDGYMQRHFNGWEDSGAYTNKIWTGIMGYSSDGFPHVGEVPHKPGQYICAGFTGHGMPQIFLSAKAVATMVLGNLPTEKADVPRLYKTTSARLASKRNVTIEDWEKSMKVDRARL
ncbi:fad dependent oxidoreductase superfamily like protein [Zymoseptoria brevis]|uniref:Fad dependent oxidoreductase superfamily like protein n=1 Tax=Zymoseptoria brevis TaxID=1047168 RepID=A0A0F4GWY4_9PEZI|nr:fad dependent oxidoreductase superfamily like protein [Zymoseptoria brevis]